MPRAKAKVAVAGPGDVGSRVHIEGLGTGTLKYFGAVRFGDPAIGDWCGVVLNEGIGKNSGVVDGTSYFECDRPNAGIFLSHRSRKVTLLGAAEGNGRQGKAKAQRPRSTLRLPPAAVPADDNTLCGWFSKKAQKIGRSRKRFFLWQPQTNYIIYFARREDQHDTKKVVGVIEMSGASTIIQVHPKQLDIVTPDRTYELRADDTDEPRRWGSRLAPHVKVVKGLQGGSAAVPHPMTQPPQHPQRHQQPGRRQEQQQSQAQQRGPSAARAQKQQRQDAGTRSVAGAQLQGDGARQPPRQGHSPGQSGQASSHMEAAEREMTEHNDPDSSGAADVLFFGPAC